jgi:hypothetical protein
VQGSRHGGQFAVNLGIHPLSIPDLRGEIPNPKKITEELCEFRRRLSEFGSDQWWKHDGTAESMSSAVRSAAAVYVVVGRPLLSVFSETESPLHTVTAAQFESGQYNFAGFGSTKVRMALALARFRAARQQMQEAKAFANIGLANLGSASGLRRELEVFQQ